MHSNYFLPFWGLPFHFLNSIFWSTEGFNFCGVWFILFNHFVVSFILFVSCLAYICLPQACKDFSPWFLLEMFQPLHLGLWPALTSTSCGIVDPSLRKPSGSFSMGKTRGRISILRKLTSRAWVGVRWRPVQFAQSKSPSPDRTPSSNPKNHLISCCEGWWSTTHSCLLQRTALACREQGTA